MRAWFQQLVITDSKLTEMIAGRPLGPVHEVEEEKAEYRNRIQNLLFESPTRCTIALFPAILGLVLQPQRALVPSAQSYAQAPCAMLSSCLPLDRHDL